MDIRTGKVIRHYMAGPHPNDLKSNFVLSLIKTASGRLVLGTSNGAYWYNQQTNDFTPLPGIPANTFIAIVMEDHDGVIWTGNTWQRTLLPGPSYRSHQPPGRQRHRRQRSVLPHTQRHRRRQRSQYVVLYRMRRPLQTGPR